MKKFLKNKRNLLLFGSIITFSAVAISSSCSFIQPINTTPEEPEKPPVKPVEKVTNPPKTTPIEVETPVENPQPPAIPPKEKDVDNQPKPMPPAPSPKPEPIPDPTPKPITPAPKPDPKPKPPAEVAPKEKDVDDTKPVENPQPPAMSPKDNTDDKNKEVEEQPKPGDKTEIGVTDPVEKNPVDNPNNPTTMPKMEIDTPSVMQPAPKKSFESNFDDSDVSDIDTNPQNLSESQKLFSYVVNDYIIKSKLTEVDNKFFNTTLHHTNLKGGNNLVWLINSIKNKLLSNEAILQEEIVDGGFSDLFKNVSQFNNFNWEISLSPLSQRSVDFLGSYLGTYFVLSYFSSQKMFNWFDNDVSKEEQDSARMRIPEFLNADLVNFFTVGEEFQPELTKLFKIINYWHSKFWISQPTDIKFTIKAVTAGNNYVLQNQIVNIDRRNGNINSAISSSNSSSNSELLGKFTISKDKTPIQNYIDKYIEYKKEKGEKFVGLFPVLFRNPDTFNFGKGLEVNKYTLFEWAYEKFILSDRPQPVNNPNIQFKNQVQKDVFVSRVFPKTSKEYIDFVNLINADGKSIYKNNESYITSGEFDQNSFSDITFEHDWNANFVFAFIKPKAK